MMLSMGVTDDLRKAIRADSRTVNALAREAGLSPIQVWRFLNDERGLTTPGVDALCNVLGLELRSKRNRKRGAS